MFSARILYRTVASISLGILIQSPVQAQDPDTRANVYGGAQGIVFDSDWNQENALGLFVGGEVPVAERWGLSLERARINSDLDVGVGDTTFESTRLGGNYHLTPIGDWQPYLGIGLGHLHLERDLPVSSAGETSFDFGAGVKRFFGENLFLRGDARTVKVSRVNTWDLALNLGVGYAFGPKPVKSVPAPAVAVDPDSDGDGVPDSRDKCPNTPRELAVDADGCPILDSSLRRQQLQVNFDFDKADIKPEFHGVIAEFARFMQTYANTEVVIEGHTDSTGPDAYNQELSERRAQAVMKRLIAEHGIAADRLSAVGYGESRPVVDNNTRENRARNRRIMADVTAEIKEQRRRQ